MTFSFRHRRASEASVSGLAACHRPDECHPTLAELGREPTIYLVPECGDPDEERACLQAVFPTVFEEPARRLVAGSDHWPTPRSLQTFTRWFDCQFHSMLLDLTDEPLIEEEV